MLAVTLDPEASECRRSVLRLPCICQEVEIKQEMCWLTTASPDTHHKNAHPHSPGQRQPVGVIGRQFWLQEASLRAKRHLAHAFEPLPWTGCQALRKPGHIRGQRNHSLCARSNFRKEVPDQEPSA